MDSNIENEVLNDFKSSLAGINFKSYNPNSNEFLTALFTGQMWKLIHELNEESEIETHYESDVTEVEKQNDIVDEINGAKKYMLKYSETQDSIFHQMASEELRHAEILIKKAYSKLPNSEERAKLKSYEDEIQNISKQLQSM